MQKVNYPVIVHLVEKMNQAISGLYFQRLTMLSPCDFVLTLSQKNTHLVISLNQSNPFLDVVNDKIDYPRNDHESHLVTIIRHHLEKGKITDIHYIEGQKIVVISIEKHYENLTIKPYKIYLELIVNHANLIVCDQDNIIQALYKASKDFSGERILRINQTYQLPRIKTPLSGIDAILNLGQLYHDYLGEYSQQIKKNNFTSLYTKITVTIDRLKSKKVKIHEELSNLINEETARLYGNLLLTNQPEINGNLLEIDGVTIPVNPDFDAIKNANLWFSRAKKVKATKLAKHVQLDLIESELNYYHDLSLLLPKMNHDELLEVEVELGIKNIKNFKHQDTKSFKPYYLIYDNVKIGFGKNNLQNDYLTFKLANKTDTFVHIKNLPGSHIVIFHPHPSDDLFDYASQLGLYLAGVPSAEFTYAKRKDIKKGPLPGSVLLPNAKSIFQRRNPHLNFDQSMIKRF